MFGFFKKKQKQPELPQLVDLNNSPLIEGDIVEALRYELGKCRLIIEGNDYIYTSLESGKKVSWLKMIDASTENQKVKKVEGD